MLDPGATIHPAGPSAEDEVLLDSNAPLQTAALASASIPGPIPPHSEPVDEPVPAPAVPIPMPVESLQHPGNSALLLATHPTAAQRSGSADVMSVTAPGATPAGAGSTGAAGSSSYGPSIDALPSATLSPSDTQQQQGPAGQAPVTPALQLPALRTGKPQQLTRGPSGGGRKPRLEPVISGHPLELRELAQQVEADTAAARDQQPGSSPHTRPGQAPAVVPSSSMGGVDISAAWAQADTAGSSSAEAVLQQQREQREGTASRTGARKGRGAWFRRLLLCCTTPDAKDDQMVGPAGPGPAGPHHRRATTADSLVLERTDSMGSVGPGDINPLEHDIAAPDKQLGAVSGGSGAAYSGGPGTPSERFSDAASYYHDAGSRFSSFHSTLSEQLSMLQELDAQHGSTLSTLSRTQQALHSHTQHEQEQQQQWPHGDHTPAGDGAAPPVAGSHASSVITPQHSQHNQSWAAWASGMVPRRHTGGSTGSAGSAGHAALAALAAQLTGVPRSPEGPRDPWVPDPPLQSHYAKGLTFVPVPKVTGLSGYWAKHAGKTTPAPFPLDLLLGVGYFGRKAHESIQGIKVSETDSHFTIKIRVLLGGRVPFIYSETFHKDCSPSSWRLRRDLAPGRSVGQMFFTQCGKVVIRVLLRSLMSDAIDAIDEDYMFVESEELGEQGGQEQGAGAAQAAVAGGCGGNGSTADGVVAGGMADSSKGEGEVLGGSGGTGGVVAAGAALRAQLRSQQQVVVMKQWGVHLASGQTAQQQVAGVFQPEGPPKAPPAKASRFSLW